MPWYPRVARAVAAALPALRPTQVANLALLVSAILAKRTLRLSELARAYPSPAARRVPAPEHDPLHRLKRPWRFLDNERFDPLAARCAAIPRAVARFGGGRVGPAVDRTMFDAKLPRGRRVRYQVPRIAGPCRGGRSTQHGRPAGVEHPQNRRGPDRSGRGDRRRPARLAAAPGRNPPASASGRRIPTHPRHPCDLRIPTGSRRRPRLEPPLRGARRRAGGVGAPPAARLGHRGRNDRGEGAGPPDRSTRATDHIGRRRAGGDVPCAPPTLPRLVAALTGPS